MDTILLVGKRFDRLAGYTMMEDGYRNTRPGSKLHLYLLRSYIYKTKGARGPVAWASEKFHELALKCNDLVFDFFAETVSSRDSKTWATARNPNAFPRCDCHQHGEYQECPYLYEGDMLIGLKKSEPTKPSLGTS
jgi:hypothetical protein